MTRSHWRTAGAIFAIAALLGTAACSDDDDGGDDSTETTEADGGGGGGDDGGGGGGGDTLQEVIDRGTLNCGVNGQLLGFSNVEADGTYTGIDVDYCKAVAAAVLGDPEAVEYTDLTAETRFTALQSGDIDVLIRNGTWTASRDGALGLDWTATTFF